MCLTNAAWTAWKKPTSSRMRSAESSGTASAKARDRSLTACKNLSLAFCARMNSCPAGIIEIRCGAVAFGVGGERLLQLVCEAEVIDDQAAGLVFEHPVDAGDRLHQPVPAHRL